MKELFCARRVASGARLVLDGELAARRNAHPAHFLHVWGGEFASAAMASHQKNEHIFCVADGQHLTGFGDINITSSASLAPGEALGRSVKFSHVLRIQKKKKINKIRGKQRRNIYTSDIKPRL